MPEIINHLEKEIILAIFRNPGINLRTLIEKTKSSPNSCSKYVNFFVKKGIVKEEKLEKNRVYLRRFFLNFDSLLARNFFMLVKEAEKEIFFNKYKKLKPVLDSISEIKGLSFLLVYGSYARLSAEKDSDIDGIIVGNIKDKEKIKEIAVTLDIEVSIKIETLSQFKKRIKDALHQQIIKENILISGYENFMQALLESS